MNCDVVQGYLFSKPVEAEKISEMLKNHSNFLGKKNVGGMK